MSIVDVLVESDLSGVAEIRIDPITGARSLFAMKNFRGNEHIVEFIAKNVYSRPSQMTVQISEDVHIELLPECLECANHSCEPNTFFDTTNMELVTVKPIRKGEEITFFYPSAEWDMDHPFQCHCGGEHCIGLVKGAKYLDQKTINRYRFTDFIKGKLASEGKWA
jgi:5-methylcytosine-specific restriction endonuclease McrA